MKRQSIFLILLLSFILSAACGCGATPKNGSDTTVVEESAESAPAEETADIEKGTPPTEELEETLKARHEAEAELKATLEIQQNAAIEEKVENVTGIFEGLEDNHTALFSFDGAESTFYFEDPAVQTVLSEAVTGSSYTFSYQFNSSLELDCIYEITEN